MHTELPCISSVSTPIPTTAVLSHWQNSLYNTLMISEYHRQVVKYCWYVFCLSWVLNMVLKTDTTFFLQTVKHEETEAVDIRHMKVARFSALHTGRHYPVEDTSGTHFCQRLSRPQDHFGNRTRSTSIDCATTYPLPSEGRGKGKGVP